MKVLTSLAFCVLIIIFAGISKAAIFSESSSSSFDGRTFEPCHCHAKSPEEEDKPCSCPPKPGNQVGVPRKPCGCPIKGNQCGINEEYKPDGECDPTCDNYDKPHIPTYCGPRCYCKPGYVRNAVNSCIEVDYCPPDPCPPGEIFKRCGSACPPKCPDDPAFAAIPAACPEYCVRGCFCLDNFYRRSSDWKCVPLWECPAPAYK